MMSMPPRHSRRACATAAHPSAVARSAAVNRAGSARSLGRVRAVVRTVAPASRSRAATASPIPLLPPVTSTRLPANSSSRVMVRSPTLRSAAIGLAARWGYTAAMARTHKKVGYSPTGKLDDVTPEMAASGIEAAFRMLEGRWKMIIIFRLFDKSVLRFSEMERAIPGVSQKMLIQQLRDLERDGIVHS